MSGHGRVRRGKATLPPYWRIEPPRPTVLVPNPAPTPAAAGKPKGRGHLPDPTYIANLRRLSSRAAHSSQAA